MFKFTKKHFFEIIPNIVIIFIFILSVVGVFILANTMYLGISSCNEKKEEIFNDNMLGDIIKKESYSPNNDINNNIRWSVSEKIHINEKNVTLIKTAVEEISQKKVLEIAGEFGIKYCNNSPTFIVQIKDFIKKNNDYLNHIRRRKQTDPKKLPNCKVTECGTWTDQSMNMERVCLSPTEFQVTLYKPNEMMANKLHLETKLVCEERLKHGLSC
ncbi:Hypothetical protein SRAE_2000511100 [Strongyloides ratti]|uniref:Uncharacterized protein n=1 Tax=Strongyloides ratti TaxID=34506 RepID=A0A090LL86_STRRB|nr:Hypothetical protein SRAE_2000511100 [Strongyloides ratti]CEF70480.1 Hypothetical protein SRAE_2000511100 [Strongyloides ratti]